MDTKTFCEELIKYYTGTSFTLVHLVALLLCVMVTAACCFFAGYLIRRYRRKEIDGDSAVTCGMILAIVLAIAGPIAVVETNTLGRSGQAPASLMSADELRLCFTAAEERSTITVDANVATP